MSAAIPPILLVEDQSKLAPLVAQLLAKLGFTDTRVAPDAVEALRMVREERFALVVCDLDLQPMTGMQFLQALRSDPDLADLPFIMAETSFDHWDIRQALLLGADGIILKPYEASALKMKILFALGDRGRKRRRQRMERSERENGLPALLAAHAEWSTPAS